MHVFQLEIQKAQLAVGQTLDNSQVGIQKTEFDYG